MAIFASAMSRCEVSILVIMDLAFEYSKDDNRQLYNHVSILVIMDLAFEFGTAIATRK